MRKSCITGIIVMLAGAFVHMHGQTTISLTFTATHNSLHQPLDSIYIKNFTQGGDTVLYGNDTVLVLEHGIGIDETNPENSGQIMISPAYPNPFARSSTLRFFLAKDETVTLRAFDLTGHELATFRQLLQSGHHSFAFAPGQEAFYLLSVETNGQRMIQKLVHIGQEAGNCRFEYAGYQSVNQRMWKGKSMFPWMPGDMLRFIGFAGTGTSVSGHGIIDDDPYQSGLYIFNLLTGIPCMEEPFAADIDGNIYPTVKIGTQCWMRENLRTRRYSNGAPIPKVTPASTWYGLTTGAMCWYNNDSATYANIYGALYNWHAVGNANGLCPAGWRVSTVNDWIILTDFLGGEMIGGGPLKATTLWSSPNTGATNSSGFTALPGGLRFDSGGFSVINETGNWWTSSSLSSMLALTRGLIYFANSVGTGNGVKGNGFSVRCIKGQLRTEAP